MDTAAFLRRHSTIVFERPRGLVSVGKAYRWRKEREGAAARVDRSGARFNAFKRKLKGETAGSS